MLGALLHEFGADGSELRIEELRAGAGPGHGELIVDVAACGVNFPDILVVNGKYQTLPPLPFTPGKEFAGVVSKVGEGVTRFAVGDRVMAQIEFGAFQERVVVHENRTFPIPDSLPFDEAAAFGLVYATSYFALTHRAKLQPGESVLVTGASGSIGSAAVQIASALGAETVAVVRDKADADRASADGARHVLVVKDPSELRDQVHRVTGGRGADVVIEAIGGELFGACLRATAWQGRIVSVGFACGDVPAVKAGYLLVKNIGVMGLQISDYQEREPGLVADAYRHILQLREAGKVNFRIADRYDLSEAGRALAAVAAGGLDGRVVITVGDAA